VKRQKLKENKRKQRTKKQRQQNRASSSSPVRTRTRTRTENPWENPSISGFTPCLSPFSGFTSGIDLDLAVVLAVLEEDWRSTAVELEWLKQVRAINQARVVVSFKL
jgi:hypothetical protein